MFTAEAWNRTVDITGGIATADRITYLYKYSDTRVNIYCVSNNASYSGTIDDVINEDLLKIMLPFTHSFEESPGVFVNREGYYNPAHLSSMDNMSDTNIYMYFTDALRCSAVARIEDIVDQIQEAFPDMEVPINLAANVLVQPRDYDCGEGDTATFSIIAGGEEPISYQWQSYINGTWRDLPGEESDTLEIVNVGLLENDKTFRCVVANIHGGEPSESAQLLISPCDIPEFYNHSMQVEQQGERYGFDLFSGFGSIRANGRSVEKPIELSVEGNTTRLVASRTPGQDDRTYFIRVEPDIISYQLDWDDDERCYKTNQLNVANLIKEAVGSRIAVFFQYFDPSDLEE